MRYQKRNPMPLKRKGKPRGRPFTGQPGPGRPPGSVDRVKVEMTAWLRELSEDDEMRKAIKAKCLEDASMMRELLARTMGKVPDVLHLETPAPLVIDLVTGPEGGEDGD